MFRVQGLGCRVQGSGFRVLGLGFWVRELGPTVLHAFRLEACRHIFYASRRAWKFAHGLDAEQNKVYILSCTFSSF